MADSKDEYDPAFVAKILELAKRPPAATFDNVEDLMAYLEADDADAIVGSQPGNIE